MSKPNTPPMIDLEMTFEPKLLDRIRIDISSIDGNPLTAQVIFDAVMEGLLYEHEHLGPFRCENDLSS